MSGYLNITGLYEPQQIELNVSIDNIARTINEVNNDLIYFKTETEGNVNSINSNIDNLTTDLNQFKTETTTNFNLVNSTIDTFEEQANNNFSLINTYISDLTNDINSLDQATTSNLEATHNYIDLKHQEGLDYTDTEVENLRNEGYIQEAVTQLLAWITSDEGKRFRKKVWDRIKNKWATFTGSRPYTELLDDVQNATTDELDKMLEVYRYIDNGFNTGNAGIRADAITSKNIILNGSTMIYNGDLYLTGNINKGTYTGTTFTQQDTLNDYMVMKGTKLNSCLEIETDKKLRLNFDTNDFELGISPTYNLKLKNDYKISGVSAPLSKDTNNILHLDYDTDFFKIVNSYFRPKFEVDDVEDTGPLFIDFSTRKLRTKYNDTLQINASKELGTTFNCKGLKSGSSLSIDTTTKLLDLNYDTDYFDVSLNKLTSKALIKGVLVNNCIALDDNNKLYLKYDDNEFQQSVSKALQLKISGNSLSKTSTGLKVNLGDNSISETASGLKINLGDNSLDVGLSGLSVSSTYKTELQQLKTQAETARTQAETAKTQAQTFSTQAQTSATSAQASATSATASATEATASATSATASAISATASATEATASAGVATTQAGIAGASAGAAAASAAAAAFSATFFQKGDKGDKGDTGPQGPAGDPRLAENPFFIETNTIKLKKDATLSINSTTGNLGVVGSNITQLDYNNISLNKPDLSQYLTQTNATSTYLAKSGGTMTGSINMTTPNTVLDFGVRLEDSLINLCGANYGFGINNGVLRYNCPYGAIHKFYVGPTNNTASIDLSGFRGSGANITGLNYNNITLNKPDLSVYYTKTEVDNISLLNSNYTSNTSNTLVDRINSIQTSSPLTFNSPLSVSANAVSIDLSQYLTQSNASTKFLSLSGGTITGSINMTTPNTVLDFGVRLENNLINLCGANYGFGINNGVLRYNVPTGAIHKFYVGPTNNSASIDTNGFNGNGANITGLNYNNITLNKPDLSVYYTKTEVDNISLLNSNYTSNTSNILVNRINSIQTSSSSPLTFNSPLSVSANAVSIDLSSYLTSSTASTTYLTQANATSTYLAKSGGTLTGALTVPNITLGSGGKINSYDDYHFIQISQPTDTLTIQEYGKIIFSIGITKTEVARINSTGLTVSGTLNATTLQQGGTPISTLISTATSSYLPLTGGTMTGALIVNSSPPNIQLGGTNGHNLAVSVSGQQYSTSANTGDMILRSINNLLLQSGPGACALKIDTGNNVSINNNLTTSGTITNGSSSYLFAGGLRIGGFDGNTLYNGTNTIGITALNKINLLTGTSLANYATRMTVDTNGNVGINNTNPQYKLHIRGGNPTTLRIETDTNAVGQVSGIEFGIPAFTSAGSAKITSTTFDYDVNNLQFYTSSGTNASAVKMTILGNGNVGINTTNPQYKLEVIGDVRVSGWYYNDNNISLKGGIYITNNRAVNDFWQIYIATTTQTNSLIFQHIATGINSLWFFNGAQTSTYSEISDERVKKEIEEINNPLDKLLKLKPKQYYLCSDKDYEKKYGLLAQDVEKELPEFVFTDEEYIANIYSYAKYDNKIITFNKDISQLINIDDELKIVLDNNDKNNLEIVIDDTPYNNRYKKRYVKVLNVIDEYSIEIDIEIPETDIFVYGKKVNDFKKLDYDSLYCLNIKATQELYKIIQNQQEQINYLLSKIS